MHNPQQHSRFTTTDGFIAALDQSGGSTPKALRDYGISEAQYSTEAEMFDLIHQARARLIASSSFTGDRVLGAILFEDTLDRHIGPKATAAYLWEDKRIVPFLKIDKGLKDESDGVQLMREIPELDELLTRARAKGVFGTKERSVIHSANAHGIAHIVDQQFEIARRVLDAGLMPILEPEINIHSEDKAEAESLLLEEILTHLHTLHDQQVSMKLTLPSRDGYYSDLTKHANIARVLALSGGYSRDHANTLLARNPGVIASFSRALLDGLTISQSDEEFDRALGYATESIYHASIA